MSQYTRKEVIEKIKTGISLEGANLQGLDLWGANLEKADLWGANLRGTNLKGAYLRGANLAEADLKNADLEGADLWGANLGGAYLRKANLNKADLREADLSVANLSRAQLNQADLREVDLEGADLRGVELIDVDLSDAVLDKADLRGTNITGANIWGISHVGWRIEGIIAEHIYNCNSAWDKTVKNKSRQNLSPGQFEILFKSMPTIELVLSDSLNLQNYLPIMGLVEIINTRRPQMLFEVKTIKKVGLYMVIRFSVIRDEYLEDAASCLSQLAADKSLPQQITQLLHKKGIDLSTKNDNMYNFKNALINAYNSNGEPLYQPAA